jgi:hypothetical protein
MKPESLRPVDIAHTLWALLNSKVHSPFCFLLSVCCFWPAICYFFPAALCLLYTVCIFTLSLLFHSQAKSEVELENALYAEALSRSKNFGAGALSAMLRALVISPKTVPPGLLQAMCAQIAVHGGDFSPRDISHGLFALSILGVGVDEAAVTKLSATAIVKAGSFKHQDVPAVFRAFRRWSRAPSPELCNALFDQIVGKVAILRPPVVTELLQAFTTLKISTDHAVFALLQQASPSSTTTATVGVETDKTAAVASTSPTKAKKVETETAAVSSTSTLEGDQLDWCVCVSVCVVSAGC